MSNDLDDLAAAGAPSTDLNDVRALARRQLDLESAVARLEEELKQARNNLRDVQEDQLPNAMRAAGMLSFVIESDGHAMKVALDETLRVSVPKVRKAQVIAQMQKWGFEAAVKDVVTVDLGKGGGNAAGAIMAHAVELGYAAKHTQDIATATVKKALKDRLKAGKNDDLAFFGAFEQCKTTIK